MTAELSALLTAMLQIDPRKRASMAEVQAHPWVSGVTRSGSAAFGKDGGRLVRSAEPQEQLDEMRRRIDKMQASLDSVGVQMTAAKQAVAAPASGSPALASWPWRIPIRVPAVAASA